MTLDEVMIAARSATGFGGAGFVETANQRLPIRQRTRIEGPADLAAVPVADETQWLRHTLYFSENDQLDYKPVKLKPLTVDTFQRKERTY